MELLKRQCFVLLFLIIGTLTGKGDETGACIKFGSNGDKSVQHKICCSNYEDKNGKCEECALGFTSDEGSSCKPCADGTFGVKCGGNCQCNFTIERCDRSKGCVLKPDSNQVSGEDGEDQGIHGKEVIIYMVGVGAVGFLVVAAIAVWKCRGHMCTLKKGFWKKSVSPWKRNDLPALRDLTKSNNKRETTYALINEKYMLQSFDKKDWSNT